MNFSKNLSPKTIGVLLITISAIGYGLQPIFGKLAFADGVVPSTATFGRFLLAAILFELHYLFLPKGVRISGRELLVTIGIAGIYAAATACYFIALQYLSAVVFSFVYYSYPAMTLMVGAAVFGDRPALRHIAAAGLTVLGMFLLLGGGGETHAIGVMWILGCSLCMAFFFHLQKHLPKKRCELYHAKVMIRTIAVLFFVWWLCDRMPNVGPLANGFVGGGVGVGWWWVFCIGLVSTYLAFTAAVVGIARLGANTAALLSGQEPLWTALFAFTVLGVWLDARQLLGAAVILAAVFYVNSRK